MLTSASKTGRATETRTSACAARWNTTSGLRCAMRSVIAGERTSRRWNENLPAAERPGVGEVAERAGRQVVDDVDLPALGEQPVRRGWSR